MLSRCSVTFRVYLVNNRGGGGGRCIGSLHCQHSTSGFLPQLLRMYTSDLLTWLADLIYAWTLCLPYWSGSANQPRGIHLWDRRRCLSTEWFVCWEPSLWAMTLGTRYFSQWLSLTTASTPTERQTQCISTKEQNRKRLLQTSALCGPAMGGLRGVVSGLVSNRQ